MDLGSARIAGERDAGKRRRYPVNVSLSAHRRVSLAAATKRYTRAGAKS